MHALTFRSSFDSQIISLTEMQNLEPVGISRSKEGQDEGILPENHITRFTKDESSLVIQANRRDSRLALTWWS